MKTAFDHTAGSYDTDFTNTPIGQLQRNSVWDYIKAIYRNGFPGKVLELNCGTGEDAIFFAGNNSDVLATDVSENMLDVAKEKINHYQWGDRITLRKLDIVNMSNEIFSHQFNLVFSNFGGLNCIDENAFRMLFQSMAKQLMPRGRMIMVIMPRFCAWESIYFLSRFRFSEAFRRRKNAAQQADLGKSKIDIWYHDPSQVEKYASPHFKLVHIQPIGIAVPPSYFKNTFINNGRILKNLESVERKLNTFKPLAGIADHYLIDLELK